MPYWGELAALTTALCWSFTSLFFAEAGKLIGAFRVNSIRLVLASGIYALILFISEGTIWPESINSEQLFLLALSALIGLVLGDLAGFKSLVLIGPRLATLLWSTAPIMVTIIAWIFLGEKLHPVELAGIIITLAGVAWVVAERGGAKNNRDDAEPLERKKLLIGVVMGLLAALGQGAGLVLSKQAMLFSGDELSAMPASFVRMVAAMIMAWLIAAGRGRVRDTLRATKNLKVIGFIAGGAFFGPFLGVWMSMVAVVLIEAGIASTLNALTPIMVLPLVTLYYKEKVSLRAYLGAIISVGGVVLLVLSDKIVAWF